MSPKNYILFLFLCALLFASACGNEELINGENYGNLLNSAEGLTLTESEHTAGWGKSQCDGCHNFNNIHLKDNSGLAIDMAAIRETVYTEGRNSCSSCHGSNGLP